MAKYLTPEGLEKLKKELRYLTDVKRKEISEKIRHTASQGDLKENAGYDEAKNEQGFVEGRIKELSQILAQAEVISAKDKGRVELGVKVCLECDGKKEKFQIVGPEEADIIRGKISFKSPLGEALLKRKKGEKVKIKTPDGAREYKITGIE
ncbi:MAG: transcription elongation factor GreA [Candidatus Pacebacteria bacterium]|nr:transcription elongation factor GreA [Candidatus Paceibacterota bacterium]